MYRLYDYIVLTTMCFGMRDFEDRNTFETRLDVSLENATDTHLATHARIDTHEQHLKSNF